MLLRTIALGAVRIGPKGSCWVAQATVVSQDGTPAMPVARCLHQHLSEQRAELCADRLSNMRPEALPLWTVPENARRHNRVTVNAHR